MKTALKALSAVALLGTLALQPAFADDASMPAPTDPKDQKDLKKVIEDQGINYVETAQKGITLSGYVDTSYTYQFAGAGEYASGTPFVQNPSQTGPANTHAPLRQFDTSNNTFNINAVKIALEKALPDKNEWAAGFRIDTIYGEDAKYLGDSAINGTTTGTSGSVGSPFGGGASSNPGNTSGLALEQALVKFRIPIGNGLDIYAGKFVTFLGYEVIESPANLNFSRGLLFTNLIPLTHTGIYADYKFNNILEAKLGIVDGWNNSTSGSVGSTSGGLPFGPGPVTVTNNGTNDSSKFGKAITGQLVVNAPGGNANITQSFIYSPQGEPGVVGQDNGPVVVYDIWGNWNPTFIKDNALLLGFNLDFGYSGASGVPAAPSSTTAGGLPFGTTAGHGASDTTTWWGAALYAQYKFTKVFSLAGRLEYIHEDAAIDPKFGAFANTTTFVGGSAVAVASQDDYSATLTASFNMWDNLLTRVEYRLDDDCGASTGIGHQINHEISLNAVYSF